jgi:amino acid transporter
MDWSDVGIRVFYVIIRKRERKKERRRPERRRKLSLFTLIPEIIFLYFLFINFSIDMQG